MNRTDPQGFSTKVTALAGGYGCRVFKNGKVVAQGWAPSKETSGVVLRELLRMMDKCGYRSDMASASRTRNNRDSKARKVYSAYPGIRLKP